MKINTKFSTIGAQRTHPDGVDWAEDGQPELPLQLKAWTPRFAESKERTLKAAILESTAEALRAVTHPRFLRSERGYQGRFYCALQEALDGRRLLSGDRILEVEYQKSRRHQLDQRPDIILHSPAEETGATVAENNVAVFALKLNASPRDAEADFGKLDEMCRQLRYDLAIFINVSSDMHHIGRYRGPYRDRVHGFAVSLRSGLPRLTHAWWEGDTLREIS